MTSWRPPLPDPSDPATRVRYRTTYTRIRELMHEHGEDFSTAATRALREGVEAEQTARNMAAFNERHQNIQKERDE